MSPIDEKLSEQFYQWEERGRGWKVWPHPVSPEPPFRPFHGHYLPEMPVIDDGRRPTFLSSLVEKLSQKLSTAPPAKPAEPEPEEEPEPEPLVRDSLIELATSLPAGLDIPIEALEQFLSSVSLCREPIAFELLGLPRRVTAQFAAHPKDAPLLRRQLESYFPEAVFQPRESTLEQTWETCEGNEMLVVEFGLAREFMLPLASGKFDPFVGIVGALSELQANEFGLFQVLFQSAQEPWAESIVNSVTHADGKPFFVNSPELAHAAEDKVAHALYAAVVRISTKAASFERALEIARDMAGSLRVFADPQGNELIPLKNDGYPFSEHVLDTLRRQSRRSGMLLTSEELTGFVHLPGSAVRSAALERESGKSKAAPAIARHARGLLLGHNVHLGETIPVRLTPEQRVYHAHIIGATGTGKSTLLFNIIRQDIENGEGVAVLDPHGDLVEKILGVIPTHRIDDVVLVDPSDPEYSVGFNILSAHSEHEKTLLASDLVSIFKRLSTSWGDQMQSVLQNTVLAFLDSSRKGTLSDMRRFLIEPAFRTEFLTSVSDPNVLYYWHKGFPQLSGNKSVGPIVTRLDMFLAQRPIAHMVSQPENRLDFAHIMDTGKIFLAKLPEGLLGRENSYLLGAVLVSKFQQLVMSRQAQQIAARRDFWIYINEFANFITPTMAEILSGARKYRIGLTLAHHELHQLERDAEVASAVRTHPFTRIVFRVGDDDARKLAESFSFFEASDLKNLERGHAIARVERSSFDFNLSVILPDKTDEIETATRRQEVITASRKKYGTPRAEVEARLRASWENEKATAKPTKAERTAAGKPASKEAGVYPSPPIKAPESIAAEVPKVTVSENENFTARPAMEAKPGIVSAPREAPLAGAVAEPTLPRDLGRGGTQHQAIQKRLKQAAETLGFRSTIEKEILEGKGSVDVLLERGDQVIACEIAITTTIDHEVGNVMKCVKAGLPNVAVVCVDRDRLAKIQAAVSGSLGPDLARRVGYFSPDKLIAHLKTLPLPTPTSPRGPTVRRGYAVRHSLPNLTAEEQREREDLTNKVLAAALERKQSKPR